jgi:CheY-like chemotaxis protein
MSGGASRPLTTADQNNSFTASRPCQIVLIEDAESDVLREAMDHAALVFELQVLGDGDEALEFIAKIDSDETVPLPRLIILDLNLPKVSGGKLLARVRVRSQCCPVPVVLTLFRLAQGQSRNRSVCCDSVFSKVFQAR